MASAWGNSWGSAWGNSWGTIAAAVTYGNLGFYDMGEKVRTSKKHPDTVRSDLLQAISGTDYIDGHKDESIESMAKRRVYDETDDLESILWLM